MFDIIYSIFFICLIILMGMSIYFGAIDINADYFLICFLVSLFLFIVVFLSSYYIEEIKGN